jgi:O-antigen/teichoic acid export membrane protein
MAGHLRSLSKQTVIYGGGLLLRRAIGFVMIPVYTRFLKPEDYGLLELLELTGFVAAFFIGFGLLQAVYRFHAEEGGALARRRVETTAILSVVGLGGAMTLALLAAAPLIARWVIGRAETAPLVVILVLGVFATELGQLILGMFRVESRPGTYVVYSLASTFVSLSLNILFLVHLGMGVRGILVSTLISNGLLTAVLLARRVPGGGWSPDPALARKMLTYCLPFIPTGLMAFTVNFIDRYFLRVFTSMEVVGVYALGYKLGMIVGFLVGAPFGLVWTANVFEIAKDPDAERVYSRVLTYYAAALLAVCAGLSVLAPELVALMAAPEYAGAAQVVPPIAWSTVFLTALPVLQVGILIRKRTIWLPVIYAGTMAINVGMNLVLIPKMGMMGAVWATVAALTFQGAMAMIVSQRLYPIPYEWGRLTVLAGAAMSVTLAAGWLPPLELPAAIAVKSLMLLVVGAAVLLWPGMVKAEERAGVVGIARRLGWRAGGGGA